MYNTDTIELLKQLKKDITPKEIKTHTKGFRRGIQYTLFKIDQQIRNFEQLPNEFIKIKEIQTKN